MPFHMDSSRASIDRSFWPGQRAVPSSSYSRESLLSRTNLYRAEISNGVVSDVLADTQNRLPDEFKIPADLRAPNEFWLKIYSVYSTHQLVHFDSHHPEVIYEVLDFRELAEKSRNRAAYEITRRKLEKRAIAAYRKAFQKLSKKGQAKSQDPYPTREELNIVRAISGVEHGHPVSFFAKHFRTQTGQRDNVIRGLNAIEPFLETMERVFSEHGLPPELTRLSLVESSFNFRAFSKAGAAGVWQFIPKSGKEFLTINPQYRIDERLSPIKSTVAAARLLTRNQTIFRNWPMTVASYHSGLVRLIRVPKRHRTDEHLDKIFGSCSQRGILGWAGKNYYSEFIALLHADRYQDWLYGKVNVGRTASVAFKRMEQPDTLTGFALRRGYSYMDLRKLNPDVQDCQRVLPMGFMVATPAQSPDEPLGLKVGRPLAPGPRKLLSSNKDDREEMS
ncbi:MAG: lytic transglycosylase domain-containing protein [Bacteriovoracia bacterium]